MSTHVYWMAGETPMHVEFQTFDMANARAERLIQDQHGIVFGLTDGDINKWHAWTSGNRSIPVLYEYGYPIEDIPKVFKFLHLLGG